MFTLPFILVHIGLLIGVLSVVLFLFNKRKSSKQKQYNLQAIFDSIWDAILIADTNRIILDCNPAFEKLFGYQLEELKGKKTDILYADLFGFNEIGKTLDRKSRQKNESHSIPYKTKSGDVITCEVSSFPMNDSTTDKHLGYIGIFRDITEQKLAEIELKKLYKGIEQSPATVIITNHLGTIEYVNPQFSKITGYSGKEVIGKNPRILQSGQTPDKVYNDLWDSLKNGKTWKGEFINRNKNGTIFLFSESISPIMDEINGGITHFIGVGEDITSRHENEKKIEQALKEKTVLLSEVHHRVKNNLAIISGLLEMQTMKTPELSEILNLSQNRIHSIAQVHELMYQSNNFSQVNLGDYINEMSKTISFSYNSEQLNVQVKVSAAHLELNVNQAIPLGMMINELITNSYSHAFKGLKEGIITIQIEQLDGTISIKYSDNGKGIPNLKSFADLNSHRSLGIELIEILSAQLNAFDQVLRGNEGFLYSFKFKIAQDAKGSSANQLI